MPLRISVQLISCILVLVKSLHLQRGHPDHQDQGIGASQWVSDPQSAEDESRTVSLLTGAIRLRRRGVLAQRHSDDRVKGGKHQALCYLETSMRCD